MRADDRPPAHETASERRRRERDEGRSRKAVAWAAAAGAARHRAAAPDSRPAAPARRHATLSPRAKRALMHRGPFREALTWLEIHGQAPEVARALARVHRSTGVTPPTETEAVAAAADAPRRRRRRRRGRRRPPTRESGSQRRPSRFEGRPELTLDDRPATLDRVLPVARSNSRMNSTSASTPSSGNAL